MRTRFCETIFWGYGFRKTETTFSKKDFWIWFPPRRRGLGNECGRKLFGFLAGGQGKKIHILKSRQSRDTKFNIVFDPPSRSHTNFAP